jgi:hypothetical protein
MGFTVKENTTQNLVKALSNIDALKADITFLLAETTAKTIRDNILNQNIKLRSRSKSWEKRAKDKRTLVNTMRYVNELSAVRLLDGSAAITGNKQLMNWLEYGTKKMKPIPHIAPSIRKLNRDLKGLLDKGFIDGLFGR